MRQPAHRDEIGANSGQRCHPIERDPSRYFDLGSPLCPLHDVTQLVVREIVGENARRSRRQRTVDIVDRLRLDLDHHLVSGGPHSFERRLDPAGQPNVIVLDEDAVVERAAVILTTAGP